MHAAFVEWEQYHAARAVVEELDKEKTHLEAQVVEWRKIKKNLAARRRHLTKAYEQFVARADEGPKPPRTLSAEEQQRLAETNAAIKVSGQPKDC